MIGISWPRNIHIHRNSFQYIGNLSDKGLEIKLFNANHYHAQLGLSFKCCAIKGLVACNNWKL